MTLRTPAYTLRMGKDCPTDTVCFHAQQCAEKYLKALLVLRELEFQGRMISQMRDRRVSFIVQNVHLRHAGTPTR